MKKIINEFFKIFFKKEDNSIQPLTNIKELKKIN